MTGSCDGLVAGHDVEPSTCLHHYGRSLVFASHSYTLTWAIGRQTEVGFLSSGQQPQTDGRSCVSASLCHRRNLSFNKATMLALSVILSDCLTAFLGPLPGLAVESRTPPTWSWAYSCGLRTQVYRSKVVKEVRQFEPRILPS